MILYVKRIIALYRLRIKLSRRKGISGRNSGYYQVKW